MHYPARISHQIEEGNYAVRFPDVPEALTLGDTLAEALENAKDALESAFDFYFEAGQSIPPPSPKKRGQRLIPVAVSVAAKILLHNEMLGQGVRPVELARRMKVPPQHITRLLDPRHTTKIDTIADALLALGKQLEVGVRPAA
jgi:antitoxin HicB